MNAKENHKGRPEGRPLIQDDKMRRMNSVSVILSAAQSSSLPAATATVRCLADRKLSPRATEVGSAKSRRVCIKIKAQVERRSVIQLSDSVPWRKSMFSTRSRRKSKPSHPSIPAVGGSV